MSIQRRHVQSLGKVIDSDMIHPKVKADLVLIYETLNKELKQRRSSKHFENIDKEEIV